MSSPIKGRGAQKQTHNRFFEHRHEVLDEYLNFCESEGESADTNKTQYLEVFPKSFVDVWAMFWHHPWCQKTHHILKF